MTNRRYNSLRKATKTFKHCVITQVVPIQIRNDFIGLTLQMILIYRLANNINLLDDLFVAYGYNRNISCNTKP